MWRRSYSRRTTHILSEGQLRLEQSAIASDGGLIEVDMAASLVYLNNKPFCVVNLHDLSERRAHEHAVHCWRQQDQLTGLPNRVLCSTACARRSPLRRATTGNWR